jgi:hypothetical protein
MIDVETWRGKSYELSGDHSRPVNRLYGLHAHRMGSWDSVIAYGNAGDLDELYPGRDRRCRVIVANYGSRLAYRKVRGAIGQQYTDGQKKWPVPKIGRVRLPRHSAPFGHCDHNVFPGFATGRDLVKLLRPAQLEGAKAHDNGQPDAIDRPHPVQHNSVRRGGSLVSPSGEYALLLDNSGTLEVRHNGTRQAIVQKVI